MRIKSATLRNIRNLAIVVALYAILFVLNKVGIVDSYIMQLVMVSCINLIMTVSLNLINGFTGQFSIGQAGFMAIGAYVSAIFTTILVPSLVITGPARTLFFFFALLIGGIAAGLVGLLLGMPCLRLKGDYLAIVTLAFGEIIRAVIRMIPFVGGPRGLSSIPSYSNYTIIFFITLVVVILVRNLVNSNFGRAFISIRENEIAAETLGINVFRYKVMSFAISAFIAGIAGGLFAHLMGFIQPDQFAMTKSTDYLVMLYAGGTASLSGSIIASAVLTILPETLRFINDWRLVIYALLMIFIMLRRPNGLYGGKEFSVLRAKNYVLKRKGVAGDGGNP